MGVICSVSRVRRIPINIGRDLILANAPNLDMGANFDFEDEEYKALKDKIGQLEPLSREAQIVEEDDFKAEELFSRLYLSEIGGLNGFTSEQFLELRSKDVWYKSVCHLVRCFRWNQYRPLVFPMVSGQFQLHSYIFPKHSIPYAIQLLKASDARISEAVSMIKSMNPFEENSDKLTLFNQHVDSIRMNAESLWEHIKISMIKDVSYNNEAITFQSELKLELGANFILEYQFHLLDDINEGDALEEVFDDMTIEDMNGFMGFRMNLYSGESCWQNLLLFSLSMVYAFMLPLLLVFINPKSTFLGDDQLFNFILISIAFSLYFISFIRKTIRNWLYYKQITNSMIISTLIAMHLFSNIIAKINACKYNKTKQTWWDEIHRQRRAIPIPQLGNNQVRRRAVGPVFNNQ